MKSAQNFYQIDEGQNIRKLDGYFREVCEWLRGGPRVKEDYLLVQTAASLGINLSLARRLIYYPGELKKLSATRLHQIEAKYLAAMDRKIDHMEKETAKLRAKKANLEAALGKGNVCSDSSVTHYSNIVTDVGNQRAVVVTI